MQRRLAAILAADVVGYSRLMEMDETGTLSALKAHRRELIDPTTERFSGRTVKLMGDGALFEFTSVVDAVNCAVAVQQGMAARNAGTPDDRHVTFRIGINLGDIIIDGDDIYGGGVNIAARLEGLAEAGGICLSGTAYDMVHDKLDLAFESLGEQRVKNIETPVRAYRIRLHGVKNELPEVHDTQQLELPGKPSLAVLPFANMSADPEQEFFADGISEDIITELSKFHSLFVIARNSSFAFKGQSVDVKEIGAKLGVRYVVEGSVRRAGKRVRITAQLIDAVEDKHLWAERYDRDLEDIFAVQDEVTHAIVLTIEPQLANSERQRARRKPAENLDSWECYQRGLWHLYQYQKNDAEKAMALFRRAISLDDGFAPAHAGLAFAFYNAVLFGFSEDREANLAKGLVAAKAAVASDGDDPFAHTVLGRIHTLYGEHEAAIAACDRALSLNPSYANAHQGRAHSLWHCGRAAEAIHSHDEAIRLSPRDPMIWVFMASKAIALVLLERFEEAIDWSRQAQSQPNAAIFAHVAEICALGHLARADDAKDAIRRARVLKPDLTLDFIDRSLPVIDTTARGLFHGGLKKAGLS